jgi:hypothetical protein
MREDEGAAAPDLSADEIDVGECLSDARIARNLHTFARLSNI